MSLQDAAIAVTGANGLVGAACCSALSEQGAIVRALVRDPATFSSIAKGGVYHFELGGAMDGQALKPPLRAIVHCAYVMQGNPWRQNVDGTHRLFDAAGVEQIVFISSLAAHAEARSAYGRSKWLLEDDVDARKGISIKPGTIIGPGGMFGKVRELLNRVPVVPIFYASHRIQTVPIDDVVRAILTALERRITGRIVVAEQTGVTQTDFYRGIAALQGKRPLFVRFPGDIALLASRAAEAIGLRLPITSDNIRGIRHIHHFDTDSARQVLGFQPQDFWSSIAELARREGNTDAVNRIANLSAQSS